MRWVLYIILPVMIVSTPAMAQEQKVFGDLKGLKLEEDVKWIDETSIPPENYIGQVFLVDKDNNINPYFAGVPVPVAVEDAPSIKKSILIKSSKDGSVSFMNIFNITGQKESVFEFQIVNSKKWYADTKNPNYLKAIAGFRNDQMTSSIFESKDIVGVVMVTGVVQKKIWYKLYRKDNRSAGGIYYVKIEGNNYYGADEYEESVKYGLLLRPIHWAPIYALPKNVTDPKQINTIAANIVFSPDVADSLSKSINTLTWEEENNEKEVVDESKSGIPAKRIVTFKEGIETF